MGARKRLHPRMRAAAVLACLFVAASLICICASLAREGSLSLSTAHSAASLGSNVSATIVANSGIHSINAVRIELIYDPTKLQFTSLTPANNAFLKATKPGGGNGKITFALSTMEGHWLTGRQIIATANFKAVHAGPTNVYLGKRSALIKNSDNTNMLIARNGISFTITDTSAPSPPSELTISERNSSTASLTWKAPNDDTSVRGYLIFRNGSHIATAHRTSYADSGLTESSSYSYRVVAMDEAGNLSALSQPISLTSYVQAADVTTLSVQMSNFGRAQATQAQGDLNGDGVVNIIDVSLLLNAFKSK